MKDEPERADLVHPSSFILHPSSLPQAVSFLLHFPDPQSRAAPEGGTGEGGGRYPSPCPAEPGLSSPAFAAATVRPARGKAIIPLSRFRYHNDGHSIPCTSSGEAWPSFRSGCTSPRPGPSVAGSWPSAISTASTAGTRPSSPTLA